MSQIIVTVSRQGKPTITAMGFPGSDCKVATAKLEAALGLIDQERLTNEFFAAAQVQELAQRQ
ncbi:DUF2997 domain-containing protein [Lacunimicrobium album]